MQIVESVVSTLQTNQIDFLFVRRTDLISIENKFRAIHIGLWLLSTLVSEIATRQPTRKKNARTVVFLQWKFTFNRIERVPRASTHFTHRPCPSISDNSVD